MKPKCDRTKNQTILQAISTAGCSPVENVTMFENCKGAKESSENANFSLIALKSESPSLPWNRHLKSTSTESHTLKEPESQRPALWWYDVMAAISPCRPNTGCPLKLGRVEPGQYLDGRLPEKLGCCWKRCKWGQQGGVLRLWSVWGPTPQYSDGDTILPTSTVFRMRR